MKALIIEDEQLVAEELIISLAQVDPGLKIIGTLGSVKTALRWFAENAEPDVIFADVELADGLSFAIFERFQLSCPVIFTTAYNEYAIQAFKVNGIDYLLKPVDWGELRVAIAKARAQVNIRSKVAFDVQKVIDALTQSPTIRQLSLQRAFSGQRPQYVGAREGERRRLLHAGRTDFYGDAGSGTVYSGLRIARGGRVAPRIRLSFTAPTATALSTSTPFRA
jgi:DNA-binding LytR/AlgR family response regulator